MPPPQLPPRKWAAVPVETTASSAHDKSAPRQFSVEPMESSSKSSRSNATGDTTAGKPMRRFAPQPVETSQKSSKDRGSSSDPGKSKFQPQPVETTHRSNRKDLNEEDKPVPRKFTPVLLDTATRSRKANKTSNPLPLKGESEHLLHAREHRRHITGTHTPRLELDRSKDPIRAKPLHPIDLTAELRRQIAPLDGSPRHQPVSMSSNRSHSYILPDLDTIESSESDGESKNSSQSVSPGQGSPVTLSDSSFVEVYKHATRIRESVDENFSQYFLQLEAKRAQQRLQEQALAAFVNSDIHEPVQHYVNDDNSDEEEEIEDRPGTWEGHDEDVLMDMSTRRESTVKISWEQLEMQRHAERMKEERNANQITKKPTESPWWNPAATYAFKEADRELKSMQDRARPPMLGDDLVFPRCPSPESARFDVTQGAASLRDQMSYLTEQSELERGRASQDEGLWTQQAGRDHVVTAAGTADHSKSVSKIGLWGGFCAPDAIKSSSGGLAPPSAQTGLMTPSVEASYNPFEASFSAPPNANRPTTTPPTPPESLRRSDLSHIDSILLSERDLDDLMASEYPDSFVTQVYNYLSLGYPSLARPFDEELAKISRISMRDLRQDDKKAKQLPRGYIRLGPDFEGGGGEGVTEDSCMRWQALKLYVREWVRQERDGMVPDNAGLGNFGTIARRGSWAL